MRSRYKALLLVGLTLGVVWLFPPQAQAAELVTSDFVIIREGTVINDDVYAFGLSIRVDGVINGDLIAFSADQVIIDGTVTGSVSSFSGSVVVNGEVGGSIRSSASRITVNGTVGGDLVVAALNVSASPDSVIGGEILTWGWRMSALGTIGDDITGSQRVLDLAGSVGGNVVVSVDRLTVVDPLVVSGNLSYRSGRDAQGLEMAEIGGSLTRRSALPPNIRVRALGLFVRGMVALFLTITAVTVVWSWPDRTLRASQRIGVRPWNAWLVGAAVFLSPLAVAGVAAVMLNLAPPEASLPLLAILVPLTLALLAVLMMVALVAGVPVAARFGSRVFKKSEFPKAALWGSLMLGVIWMLPLIGWVVPVIALPLGLGAWILTRTRQTGAAEVVPVVEA